MPKTAQKARELTYSFPNMPSEEKLRELVLYIADRCSKDRHFGRVKLNKVLWFADASSYAFTGKPVTGATYIRLNNGPVPKPMKKLRSKMLADGDIAERHQGNQRRDVALRDADCQP